MQIHLANPFFHLQDKRLCENETTLALSPLPFHAHVRKQLHLLSPSPIPPTIKQPCENATTLAQPLLPPHLQSFENAYTPAKSPPPLPQVFALCQRKIKIRYEAKRKCWSTTVIQTLRLVNKRRKLLGDSTNVEASQTHQAVNSSLLLQVDIPLSVSLDQWERSEKKSEKAWEVFLETNNKYSLET